MFDRQQLKSNFEDLSNFLLDIGFELSIQHVFMEFAGNFEGTWIAHYQITHVQAFYTLVCSISFSKFQDYELEVEGEELPPSDDELPPLQLVMPN